MSDKNALSLLDIQGLLDEYSSEHGLSQRDFKCLYVSGRLTPEVVDPRTAEEWYDLAQSYQILWNELSENIEIRDEPVPRKLERNCNSKAAPEERPLSL
jgi:hypothetical protein